MALVDQCVRVSGGAQVPEGVERPVLIVVGGGGSGRSHLLRQLWTEWGQQAPAVWVDPRSIDDSDMDSLRPVLIAIMQGLSDPVLGYTVEFPRVVLAYIAMQAPVPEVDPARAREIMRARMNIYRDRAKLIDFLGELVGSFGSVVQGVHVPGFEVVGKTVAHGVAQRIVDKLRRSSLLPRFTWDAALRWYGHQDTGLSFTPETALVLLSRQAHIDSAAVRRGVEDLLVGALLADLRESLARAEGRPHNALVLLDEGDAGPTRAFVSALVRIRASRDPRAGLGDPLVVVTTSRGGLVEDLPGEHGQRFWDDARLSEMTTADLQVTGSWLPVRLGCLGAEDVLKLAKAHLWPADLGASRVADAVYRLTGGYAVATELLLRALATDPTWIENLDAALRSPFGANSTLEEALFTRVAAGLTPRGRLDEDLLDLLVIIAAARDLAEAQQLLTMLHVPVNPTVIASTTLWSGAGPRGHPTMPAFVRDLGLRALARRPRDHPQAWDFVFTVLRRAAEQSDDEAGRLHHELALGNHTTVVDALTAALPATQDEHWLALLDQVTAAYDPRQMATREQMRPVTVPPGPREAVDRLVTTLHALSDPRLSARAALRGLYLLAENDYRVLAGSSLVFVLRAQHYRRLAEALE
ncbi:MAG TPA: hypothetical protein VFQ77_20355 [Pseudonocardiaceae bacterium]|nr:hypothetical protein [Pseudonocardiaceae bacterium]